MIRYIPGFSKFKKLFGFFGYYIQKIYFLFFWGQNPKNSKTRNNSFVALLIPHLLTPFMSETFFCISKAVGLTALLAKPFLGRKWQNMTSLWCHFRPTYHSLWKHFWSPYVKLMSGRVLKVWWRSAQRFSRYIEKLKGGQKIAPPPPLGRLRDNQN